MTQIWEFKIGEICVICGWSSSIADLPQEFRAQTLPSVGRSCLPRCSSPSKMLIKVLIGRGMSTLEKRRVSCKVLILFQGAHRDMSTLGEPFRAKMFNKDAETGPFHAGRRKIRRSRSKTRQTGCRKSTSIRILFRHADCRVAFDSDRQLESVPRRPAVRILEADARFGTVPFGTAFRGSLSRQPFETVPLKDQQATEDPSCRRCRKPNRL
jgi:hypothetical protein